MTFERSEVKTVVASAISEEPMSTAYSSVQHHSKYVLLTTTLKSGGIHELHDDLDFGYQISMVSEFAVKLLRLPRCPTNLPVMEVGERVRCQVRHWVNIKFERNLDGSMTIRVSKRIPSVSEWKIPIDIELTDPQFKKPKDVDLLIDAELIF